MKTLFKLNCWLYDRTLSLYSGHLRFQHGEEMRFLFRQQLADALRHDPAHVATLWRSVAVDTLTLVGPTYLARLKLLSLSTLGASALVMCFLLTFCSFANIHVVHGYSNAEPLSMATPDHPSMYPRQRP